MINLIPQEEKKKMLKAFYYRLLVLALVIGGVSCLIASVVVLPSYFVSSAKINLIEEKLAMQKKQPVSLPDQETLKIIEDLNKKLALFEKKDTSFEVSKKIINAIILKKVPSIKITNISYENESSKNSQQTKKVNIQGTAPSRSTLLLFRQALEDDITFKSVNLPISNFIKGSNIQFFLTLIPS